MGQHHRDGGRVEVLQARAERGLDVVWGLTPRRPVRSLVAGAPVDGVSPLVVVPGLGALGYLAPLVHACATWTQVHLLDVPGFGHRVTADCPAGLGHITETVGAWLDGTGGARVLLLGHSTGAQAALRVALDRPDRVALLALGGATFPPQARAPGALLRRVVATLRHERAGELPAVLPYYLRGARRLPELLASALADRPEDVVGAVAPPVLVLRGEHDLLCPPDWAARLTRGGRDVVLPGGHNAPYTSPEATSAALRQAEAAARAGR